MLFHQRDRYQKSFNSDLKHRYDDNVETYTCSKCKLVSLLEEPVQQLEVCLYTLWLNSGDEAFLESAEQTLPKKQ